MKSVALLFMTMFFLFLSAASQASVDTLKGTVNIEDAVIYSWADCNAEVGGEDCRRYNAGNITNIGTGQAVTNQQRRIILRLPGWNGIIPDSALLLLYCKAEADQVNRQIFLFPLTKRTYEGVEAAYNLGDYPSPDSGVTWNHVWLDVGDGDSLLWTTTGGDYTTAVACTMTVSDTGQYIAFRNFNRILQYWDTSGNDYGAILINENAFPANTSLKTFGSSEGSAATAPMAILYYSLDIGVWRRRDVVNSRLNWIEQ